MLVARPLESYQEKRECGEKNQSRALQEENPVGDSRGEQDSPLSPTREISDAPIDTLQLATDFSSSASKGEPKKIGSRPDRPSSIVVQGIGHLPPDEEARLGRLLHLRILDDHPVDPASPYPRLVFEAARRLIESRTRKEEEITITVLDSEEVNAFSHLGGYIYLSRGLFKLASTEEDFQFIIGHELGHLHNRDGQRLVAEATDEGRLTKEGTLGALYHQVARGYPEAMEFAADDWVLSQMVMMDETRRECLSFLRKFVGLSERAGFRNGSGKPGSDPDAAWQDVENHYRSHPAAWRRLNRMESRFKQIPVPVAPDAGQRPL